MPFGRSERPRDEIDDPIDPGDEWSDAWDDADDDEDTALEDAMDDALDSMEAERLDGGDGDERDGGASGEVVVDVKSWFASLGLGGSGGG